MSNYVYYSAEKDELFVLAVAPPRKCRNRQLQVMLNGFPLSFFGSFVYIGTL